MKPVAIRKLAAREKPFSSDDEFSCIIYHGTRKVGEAWLDVGELPTVVIDWFTIFAGYRRRHIGTRAYAELERIIVERWNPKQIALFYDGLRAYRFWFSVGYRRVYNLEELGDMVKVIR